MLASVASSGRVLLPRIGVTRRLNRGDRTSDQLTTRHGPHKDIHPEIGRQWLSAAGSTVEMGAEPCAVRSAAGPGGSIFNEDSGIFQPCLNTSNGLIISIWNREDKVRQGRCQGRSALMRARSKPQQSRTVSALRRVLHALLWRHFPSGPGMKTRGTSSALWF